MALSALREKILRMSTPEPNTGCWLWVGAANRYGNVHWKGSTLKAHRASYMAFIGEIPPSEGYHGTCVCHKCDVTLCVNPCHLFLGSQNDNLADMGAKGRRSAGSKHSATLIKGEHHKRSKLTESDVALLFSLREQGLSQNAIGSILGVSQTQVGNILRGKHWGHLCR